MTGVRRSSRTGEVLEASVWNVAACVLAALATVENDRPIEAGSYYPPRIRETRVRLPHASVAAAAWMVTCTAAQVVPTAMFVGPNDDRLLRRFISTRYWASLRTWPDETAMREPGQNRPAANWKALLRGRQSVLNAEGAFGSGFDSSAFLCDR